MRQTIADHLPWLLSAITIYSTYLAGNLHRYAWVIGIGNQLLWLVWIWASDKLGFLPMNFALTLMMLRNHLKWSPAN